MTGATGACNSGKVTPATAKGSEMQAGSEKNRADANDDMTGDSVWLLLHKTRVDDPTYREK